MSFVGNIFKQRVSEMRNSTFLFFPLPLERITKRREHSSKHGVLQERDFRLMCNIVWCGKGLVNLTGETLSLTNIFKCLVGNNVLQLHPSFAPINDLQFTSYRELEKRRVLMFNLTRISPFDIPWPTIPPVPSSTTSAP